MKSKSINPAIRLFILGIAAGAGGAAAQTTVEQQLPEVRVEGATEPDAFGPVRGYRANRSATATRTDTPIGETPVSIKVVPREVIEDQGATRLQDVYRNVSGVTPAFNSNNVSATESPIIRGFEAFNIYRNGLPLGQIAPVELTNIERVEILKGPSSVLYGRGEPGGVLNLVTKRPLFEDFRRVDLEAGRYDYYRAAVDVSGPLDEARTLAYRVNLAYTDTESFRDFVENRRFFVAPSLLYRPSGATEFLLEGSYLDETYTFDTGTAFGPDGNPAVPISRFLGQPDFNDSQRQELFVNYSLRHDVSADWTLRHAFQYHRNTNRLNAFRLFGPTDANFTVSDFYDGSVPRGETFNALFESLYRLRAGGAEHQILGGVDLRYEPAGGNTQNGPRQGGLPRVDIRNPDYTRLPVPDSAILFEGENRWTGVYLQDQIAMAGDRLHLLIGGRYDRVEQESTFNGSFSSQGDEAFTGRVGVLYKVTDAVSPYVSFSQSFSPSFGIARSGPLDPERATQYEAGLKLGREAAPLGANVALYEITKDEVAVSDPNDPGFSVPGGEQRSRGFEVDVTGQIDPRTSVIATYAYTDTKVIASDFLPDGARFQNVPLHSASVWLTHRLPVGVTLAGGAFYVGARPGDGDSSFTLDDYLVVDLAAWYDWKLAGGQVLRVQANVRNLFDEEHYLNASSTGNVVPGSPRAAYLRVSLQW